MRSDMDNGKNQIVTLTASSDYNTAGKQHIGLVVGPDRKWGLKLEFVGAKSGKRMDYTTAKVTEPGLYKVRSTTRKGTNDSYVLIWDHPTHGLDEETVDEQRAVELAKGSLSTSALNAAGRQAAIEWQEQKIAANAEKPDDEIVKLPHGLLTLDRGEHTHATIRAVRRAELAILRGDPVGDLPVEIGDAPSDPSFRRRALEDERTALLARLAEIDAELAR